MAHTGSAWGKTVDAMADAPTPADVTGRPGLVASVDHMRGLEPGRLVVVREPAGYLTEMVGSAGPVFSWLCLVIGAPVVIDGKGRREIYIAAPCLTPISTMNSDQIGELVREQAREDFAAAPEDVNAALVRSPMTAEQLDDKVSLAGVQWSIQYALEAVPGHRALG